MDFAEIYQGSIQYDGGHATFEVATEADAPQLAQIYKNIAVTTHNYKEKFDEKSPQSFSKTGGMFTTHTQSSILTAMSSSWFAVLRAQNKIQASFWVSLQDPDFAGFVPCEAEFSGRNEEYSSLCEAIQAGRVFCPLELIVPVDSCIPKASLLLFHTIFAAAARMGYTHSLGVVYQLHGYSDEHGKHSLSMCNKRSFTATSATGGFTIGTLPVREKILDGYSVLIEPHVFCFPYASVVPTLGEYLHQQSIVSRFACESANKET